MNKRFIEKMIDEIIYSIVSIPGILLTSCTATGQKNILTLVLIKSLAMFPFPGIETQIFQLLSLFK